jgi:tetratricopeptide (TPR) repeat protein
MLRRWPEETKSWLSRLKYGNFQSGRCYAAILQNNFMDALKHADEALTVFGGFYEEDPENMTVRLLYANELQSAAYLAAKLGMPDDGEFFYSAGEELWRGLAADDPQPLCAYGLALTLSAGGLLRFEQGRAQEAEELLDEAEELNDGLIHLDPDNEEYLLHKSVIAGYREIGRQK